MFSRAGFLNGFEGFEIDEQIDPVFAGETGHEFPFMLGNAAARLLVTPM